MTKNSFLNQILIIIAAIFFTLISMLPLGIFSILVTAVIASIIGYSITKYHYWFLPVVCGFVFFVYFVFTKNISLTLISFMPVLILGTSLGICYNLKLSEFKLLTIITITYTLYVLLNIKILQLGNIDIVKDVLFSSVKNYTDALASLYEGQIAKSEIDTLLGNVIMSIRKLMPSVIIMFSACTGLLSLYIFKKVLKLTKCDISQFKSFSEHRADKTLGIMFFIFFAVEIFMPEKGYLADAILNVCVISEFVFYIFGLSFIDFILKLKMKNLSLKKIVLILIVIFSVGTPMLFISILGALDSCFDYREKISKSNLPK